MGKLYQLGALVYSPYSWHPLMPFCMWTCSCVYLYICSCFVFIAFFLYRYPFLTLSFSYACWFFVVILGLSQKPARKQIQPFIDLSCRRSTIILISLEENYNFRAWWCSVEEYWGGPRLLKTLSRDFPASWDPFSHLCLWEMLVFPCMPLRLLLSRPVPLVLLLVASRRLWFFFSPPFRLVGTKNLDLVALRF